MNGQNVEETPTPVPEAPETEPRKEGGLGKIVGTAIVITIVSFLLGWLTCGWLFSWVYELEPTNVWKFTKENPPTGAVMGWVLLGDFVLALILVGIYNLIKGGIPGQGARRGLNYGLIVWALSLGGMFATLMWTTINPGVVLYWTLVGLVIFMIKGAIIGAMVK
jgi:hypothetical protein